MGSDIINRRTLLTGTALLGLGGLLTACGQQAANEASASASSAAATPSETTSASAAVSETAASTPSPVITRGYSGGSKAPAGEYREADEYGMAQNVPLPKAKPQQYPETFAGLREMMTDWVRARNYGIQTGDMQYVWPYMLDTYEEDIKFLKDIEGLYQRGGWVIAGTSDFQAESTLNYDDKAKEYWVLTRRLWTYAIYVNSDGRTIERSNTNHENEIFMMRYRYKDGYWYLSGYVSNKQLREQGIIQ
ncbi:DUF6318 family protein [Rothia mucilaginosa]|jgi:hypothetical protein|uniref:DUF6318 family protein n=1 Tax=Rothia mucilaginosa TaxID=43675 RepID=UPI0028EB7160|nr:DUF6318 family protein [Rothia mucilaginosa]